MKKQGRLRPGAGGSGSRCEAQFLCAVIACALSLPVRAGALRLAPCAAETTPLAVGSRVPALMLKTTDGATFDLGRVLAEKPTVLVVFRGGWCPYCSAHLGELAMQEPRLIELGVQIIAISTDSPKKLRTTAEENKLNYRLLSDREMVASSTFGVAYRVSGEMQRKYAEWQTDVPAVPAEPESVWLPVPAAFVIGRDGVVKFVYSDPDASVRISGPRLMDAVAAVLK